ncbi:hypothetical protein BKA70DRAFT_1569595 [Coprinopsis sp. MPI-PUGE-AT-0042]|nr:hypothetical protein BKA70DRAFT_1569595 [Coprinopsis sp. MPI-PUGE-AT-0042]
MSLDSLPPPSLHPTPTLKFEPAGDVDAGNDNDNDSSGDGEMDFLDVSRCFLITHEPDSPLRPWPLLGDQSTLGDICFVDIVA